MNRKYFPNNSLQYYIMRKSKPSARAPFSRMIYIDYMVRRNRYPSVTDLIEYFEVTERTIYRDIEYMRDQWELPIELDDERGGYYYSEPAPSLPGVVMQEGELFAIFIAKKVLAQYRGTPYEGALRSAFDKIREALTDDIELYTDEWDSKLSFSAGSAMDIEATIFNSLQHSLHCGLRIKILYYAAYRDEESWREIDPYFLSNLNGDWYLVAYCHLRKQLRTFVPSRIKEIEVSDTPFDPPSKLTLQDYLHDSFKIETSGEAPRVVRIRFSPTQARYIRERQWHSSQAIEELESGGLILTLIISSEWELIRWLLSYGADAEVLEPPELRKKMKEIVGEMGNVYSD